MLQRFRRLPGKNKFRADLAIIVYTVFIRSVSQAAKHVGVLASLPFIKKRWILELNAGLQNKIGEIK